MGPDTYSASATAHPSFGGLSSAKKMVLSDVNQYCTQMGKEILITNVANSSSIAAETVDITFRCLSEDDLELQRPEYRRTPDAVIEDRR